MSLPSIDSLAYQNFCVLLPAFNEELHIAEVVQQLRALGPDVLVIDDGSADATAERGAEAGAQLVRLEQNQGKGAALQAGFDYGINHGYDAVVTMDADGQHDPKDAIRFMDAYNRTGIPVIIGNRMADKTSMPWLRRRTNLFMSWLLRRQMRQYIADSQNGFRLYQCDILRMVKADAAGYAAESELLLKLDAIGVRMGSVPVKATYGDEQSSIRPLRDTRRFFRMLFRQLRTRQLQPKQPKYGR